MTVFQLYTDRSTIEQNGQISYTTVFRIDRAYTVPAGQVTILHVTRLFKNCSVRCYFVENLNRVLMFKKIGSYVLPRPP